MKSNLLRFLATFSSIFFWFSVASAEASTSTIFFSGSGFFNDVPPPGPSLTFGGSFTFDPTITDTNSDPHIGIYPSTAILQYVVTWTSSTRSGSAGFDDQTIRIEDAVSGDVFPDKYRVSGQFFNAFLSQSAEIDLVDFFDPGNKDILTSDQLVVPSLALFNGNGQFSFTRACFDFSVCQGNVSFVGTLSSLVVVPSVTPLPATLPIFATGLGALGLLGWRRKRKAVV